MYCRSSDVRAKDKNTTLPPLAQLNTASTASEGAHPRVNMDDNEPAMMGADGQDGNCNSKKDLTRSDALRDRKQENNDRKRPGKLNLHAKEQPKIIVARREESPTELSALKHHNFLLNEEKELIKSENGDLKGVIIDLQAQKGSLVEQNRALTADKTALTTKNEKLMKKNESLTADKRVLTTTTKTLSADKRALTEQMDMLATSNEALSAQNDNLVAQTKAVARENAKIKADLVKRYKEYETLVNTLVETERNKNIKIGQLQEEKKEADETITHLSCQISEVTDAALCLSSEKGILEKQLRGEDFGGLLVHFKECHNKQKLDLQENQLRLIDHLLGGTAYRAQRSINDQSTFNSMTEVLMFRNIITGRQKDLLTEIFNHWVNNGKP